MDVLLRKVKLRQPYVGVFLKKDDANDSEVVKNLSDIYPVGTFCQIQEFQDLGDKLRMIVIAHRRIRITNQLYEEPSSSPVSSSASAPPPMKEMTLNILDKEVKVLVKDEDIESTDAVKRRSRRKRISSDNNLGDQNTKTDVIKPRVLAEGEQQSVLMVEVENIKTEEFQQTDEVKALTQEVIKTLRDIISMNSLYRENLQHMIHQNQRVVNNPSYLCDLGASLAAAEPSELQDVLHEMDVSFRKVNPFYVCVIHSLFRYLND